MHLPGQTQNTGDRNETVRIQMLLDKAASIRHELALTVLKCLPASVELWLLRRSITSQKNFFTSVHGGETSSSVSAAEREQPTLDSRIRRYSRGFAIAIGGHTDK
jgi:hypothetical protein